MAEEDVDNQTVGVTSDGQPQLAEEDSAEKLVSGNLVNSSSVPRENLIYTAVSFLNHNKVRNTSIAHKKSFLKRKGLTDEEILEAFKRSGTPEDDTAFLAPQSLQPYYQQHPSTIQVPHVTAWNRIRETIVAGILLWGISKAAHRIYKEYISPYFGIKSASERRMEIIENSVLEMQNNMVETMKKVQDVVDTIQQQQLLLNEELLKSKSNGASYPQSSRLSNEIKSELTSIKGILLSRKQFTPIPNITATLPSWQLSEESSNTNNNNSHVELSVAKSSQSCINTAADEIKSDIKEQINPVAASGQSSADSSDISPVNSEDLAPDIEDLSNVNESNNQDSTQST
ncbi:peroxisomal membrane protein PEX14 [Octopus bimaculoides]|uniref:Peroxisomal membrane protein PEX14 n=1 Tax=Octopus bimaculoides TaxID=37653 RepID=A0A0L8ICR9_OCTBM|nr:peroxisomal membrane protein PEX14 [Octopus bimaculoides]|eukprot:XP_014776265.1 PREDICTED: peroxisomal membrane protein PEX14-like [Octopus bimaculoides]